MLYMIRVYTETYIDNHVIITHVITHILVMDLCVGTQAYAFCLQWPSFHKITGIFKNNNNRIREPRNLK